MSVNPHLICEDNIPIIVPKRILVFAGHPDDELISCGGTIVKYRNLGSEIKIIIATTGSGGYARENDKENVLEQRKKELSLIKSILRCEFVELNYLDLVITREKISQITNLIRNFKPQLIFIPHYTDFHRVHRNLSLITREAIYHCSSGKAYGGHNRSWTPLGVYYYESPSCKFQYIEGSVFVIVNIENYWEEKKEIFNQVYTSQKEVLDRVLDWAEDTAILRGNEINAPYGEAFVPETTYTPLKILLV
ncbi:MAG: PIG-L family deacetylase [Candidatus Lokiarchaeota archaeon]|nr:PIG-L family deacetylase [Candidatus Lokiarchaeota archaeon]